MNPEGGRMNKWVLLSVVVVLVLAGCSEEKSPSQPDKGIPVYKGSEVYSAPMQFYQMMGLPADISVKAYYVKDGDVKEILEWYKNNLKGYTVVNEVEMVTMSSPHGTFTWGAIIFEKDDRGVGIWVMGGDAIESGRGAVYYIAEGPLGKFEGYRGETSEMKAEELPYSDRTSGGEPVRRYPESVMLEHYTIAGFPSQVSIVYGTKDSLESIEGWYRSELSSEGWTLEGSEKSGEGIILRFAKDGNKIEIHISPPNEGRNYSEITVDYLEYSIPSEDQASGEEPISRYPSSVMLSYSSVTYGGKSIMITYASKDSLDSIYGWYKDYLSGDWRVVMEESRDSSKILTASKQDALVVVTVSKKEGYTEIEVQYTQAK
jgi:hypothetical protein